MREVIDTEQKSELWHSKRAGKLTASNAKLLMKLNITSWLKLWDICILGTKPFTNAAMQRGIEMEEHFRVRHLQYMPGYYEVGLVIDNELKIAASPDFMLGKDVVGEIKTIYTLYDKFNCFLAHDFHYDIAQMAFQSIVCGRDKVLFCIIVQKRITDLPADIRAIRDDSGYDLYMTTIDFSIGHNKELVEQMKKLIFIFTNSLDMEAQQAKEYITDTVSDLLKLVKR